LIYIKLVKEKFFKSFYEIDKSRTREATKSVAMKYKHETKKMISWVFNISIISILVILILHYVFEFFGHTESTSVNKLQVQKYKSIIEKMTRDADTIKTAFEEDRGIVEDTNTDLEEDLELYIREIRKPTVSL